MPTLPCRPLRHSRQLDPELLSADAATNQWIATDELNGMIWPDLWRRPTIDKSDLAFLQYTSRPDE